MQVNRILRSEEATDKAVGDAIQAQTRKHTYLNGLLNAALVLTVCGCILVYALPIFSNDLHAPGSVHGFGTVKAGTEVHHDFTVRNLHPWAVTVLDVHSDCGCTRSVVGKTLPFRLAPLQAVTVSTALNTLGKKSHIEQDVRVITDDNQKGTSLRLRGTAR